MASLVRKSLTPKKSDVKRQGTSDPLFGGFAAIVLFILITFEASSQEYLNSPYYSSATPKNPKVSSLGEFGKTPINHYNGLPEVSLDLATLTSRDLSLPISINYDASGIKTGELSGPVGLKWHLSAGGFIARELTGRPDEDPVEGYWKYALETNYYNSISGGDINSWVNWTEKNERDRGPDEFTVTLPGRTIRFVFDKNKNAVTIPRQKAKITYTLVSNKIDQFVVTTEDGVKYTFGGTTQSVEETKIERYIVKFKFGEWTDDRYTVYSTINDYGDGYHNYYFAKKNVPMSRNVETESISQNNNLLVNFYNSKWYLISIVSPTGDFVNFNYTKSGTVVYSGVPSATKVRPSMVSINGNYTFTISVCNSPTPFGCWGGYHDVNITVNSPEAIAKMASSDPGVPPPGPTTVNPTDINSFFKPESYPTNPGSVHVSHSLITQSAIVLADITTAAGNRAYFYTSARVDLPNGKKYTRIAFHNNASWLKDVKFNFADIAASTNDDMCWISEGAMLAGIPSLPASSTWVAHEIRSNYSETSIPNLDMRKFVYDGIKDYNYWRLFLESIELTTMQGSVKSYDFTYNSNRSTLKRRTTPVHDLYGYSRSTTQEPVFSSPTLYHNQLRLNAAGDAIAFIANGYNPSANLESGRDPLRGILQTITYPTGGSTTFDYFPVTASESSPKGPRLKSIQDFDGMGGVVTRELEYSGASTNRLPVTKSYQEFQPPGASGIMKQEITSSDPQNDAYSLTRGGVEGYSTVTVYNGPKVSNAGYEKFYFHNAMSPEFKNQDTEVFATPLDNWFPAVSGHAFQIFPFPKDYELEHFQGLQSRHEVYASNGKLLREKNSHYTLNPYGYTPIVINGFKGGSYVYTTTQTVSFMYGYQTEASYRYRYSRYKIQPDWVILDQTTEKVYDQSSTDLNHVAGITSDVIYGSNTLLPIETKTYNSDDQSIKNVVKTRYPSDYPNDTHCTPIYNSCVAGCASLPPVQRDPCESACLNNKNICEAVITDGTSLETLRTNNQLSDPVEVVNLIEVGGVQKVTSAVVKKYRRLGPSSFVKPVEVWGLKRELQNEGPGALQYNPVSISTSSGQLVLDSKLRQLHTFNTYDGYGNVVQQTLSSGIVSNYQWGFNNSLVTTQTINPLSSSPQQSTYDHFQGVGLNSVTDPNGRVSTFVYDLKHRLKVEREGNNGPIRKRYRYHYANEVEGFTNDVISSSCAMAGNPIMMYSSEPSYLGQITGIWNFGDGTTVSTTNNYVEKTYSNHGTYAVVCRKENPEYLSKEVSKSITVYRPITLFNLTVWGPTSYDVCNINNPVTGMSSLELQITGDAFNIQWTECFEGSCWSYPFGGVPGGFGSPGIVGSWTVTVTATDACGNIYTSSTGFTNYASNPMCEFY
ncbi:MAG: hypothetical protein JNK10_06295 [Cyclobacteriaceae bacterium]|nr:hypothetical protein [Cyclobacteriaceae bacterium]